MKVKLIGAGAGAGGRLTNKNRSKGVLWGEGRKGKRVGGLGIGGGVEGTAEGQRGVNYVGEGERVGGKVRKRDERRCTP